MAVIKPLLQESGIWGMMRNTGRKKRNTEEAFLKDWVYLLIASLPFSFPGMAAYRFLADKDKPTENDLFPGWPLTIPQMANDGRKSMAFLSVTE